jgi:hypothetical protein
MAQNRRHQLMTASTVHVSNLTPPGPGLNECNLTWSVHATRIAATPTSGNNPRCKWSMLRWPTPGMPMILNLLVRLTARDANVLICGLGVAVQVAFEKQILETRISLYRFKG